jgi:hypothetical protein
MQDNKRATEAAPTQCKGSNLSSDSQICHELDDDYIQATTEEKDPYLIDLSEEYPEPDYLIQVGDAKQCQEVMYHTQRLNQKMANRILNLSS